MGPLDPLFSWEGITKPNLERIFFIEWFSIFRKSGRVVCTGTVMASVMAPLCPRTQSMQRRQLAPTPGARLLGRSGLHLM